jgi:hypothetical protein
MKIEKHIINTIKLADDIYPTSMIKTAILVFHKHIIDNNIGKWCDKNAIPISSEVNYDIITKQYIICFYITLKGDIQIEEYQKYKFYSIMSNE